MTITDPGRVCRFRWGTQQQSTLTLSYPATADNARFWPAPQPGSELGGVNQTQDAWVIGNDWYASMTLRWLTPSLWCEVQAFLDWAMAGGSFSFIPDAVNSPLLVLPGCLLVEPFGEVDPGLEDNGLQTVEIKFRNNTFDLGFAWR